MKKIPSIFKRDFGGDPSMVLREPEDSCSWVFKGGGFPTRKRDGTACMFRGGRLLKRYDAKGGKTPPDGFEPCQDPDPVTGHWPGWVPVGPDDKWHVWAHYGELVAGVEEITDGTYELCGPKLQTNPEKLDEYLFFRHGEERLEGVPLDYDGIKAWLSENVMEGIVWHHPAGVMAKIKRTDFGLKWPV